MPTPPLEKAARDRAGAALLLFLLLALSSARAEPLLTGVLYAEGSTHYELFSATGVPASTGYSYPLEAGMALPAASRVDTAKDAKVLISPIPSIRYLIEPGTRILNQLFGFRPSGLGGASIDYRLRVESGILVGDVVAAPAEINNRIETPRGTVIDPKGHFLIDVRPDGSVKFAILSGSMKISVPQQGDYALSSRQELLVLSDSMKAALLQEGGGSDARNGTLVEARASLGHVAGPDIVSLDGDPEAIRLLSEPFPEPNTGLFASPSSLPALPLEPGQPSFFLNPVDFAIPNPANTSNNPTVSPVFPQ